MSAPRPLEERVALVSGATGLLGREHCRALSAAGATVVAADLPGSPLEGLCAALREETGGRVVGAEVDVTDPAPLERVSRFVSEEVGELDVLVNNAALDDKVEAPALSAEESAFERYPLDLFRRTLEVNVTGVFLASQILGRGMAARGRGSIVNIASVYALVGPDPSLYRDPEGRQLLFKSPAYPASKGAVVSLTRHLAAYWGERGVRVNCLVPGGVENGQESSFQRAYGRRTPLGRMARKDEMAGALLFLASDAGSYVTGSCLVVDGGFTAW